MARPACLVLVLLSLAGALWAQESPEQALDAAVRLYQQKSYAAAAMRLQSFLAQNRTHPKAAAAALVLGQCQLLQGRPAQAAEAFSFAMRTSQDPQIDVPAQLGFGQALLRSRRYAEAEGALQAVLAKKATPEQRASAIEGLSAARLQLADGLLAAKRYGEARSTYRRLLDSAPAPATRGLAEDGLIQSLMGEKRFSEAVPPLRAAIGRQAPGSTRWAKAQLSLGGCLFETGDYGGAAQAYRAAARSKQPVLVASALYGQARALEQQKRLPEALKAYRDVAHRYPMLPQGADSRRRADALEAADETGPLPKTAAGLQARIQRRPVGLGAARARFALASLYLDQGKSSQAAALLAAVRAAPEAPASLKLSAAAAEMEARVRLKEYDKAEALATEVDQPASPAGVRQAALRVRAAMLEARGKTDEAEELWLKAARESPKSPQPFEALLRLADARLSAGQYEEAEKSYQRLLGMGAGPWDKPARLKRASALYNLSRYQEAEAAYQEFVRRYPKEPDTAEALYWQALAAEKLGNKAEALSALNRLISDFPNHTRAGQARTRLALLKLG
ncbi:MAG TPA: tetratricopeptide repeat protein, partial [Armatimonadota bacterium]